jgi:restriction system protein
MVALMAKLHDGTHHAVLVKKGSVVPINRDEEDEMSKQTKVQKQNAAIEKHVKGKRATKAGKVTATKAEAVNAAMRAVEADKKARPKKEGSQMSGLDAAAKVLAEAGKPMSCKEMVETMLAQKLWSTGGKTPQATIYAAVIREIATKKETSRFRKVDRGQFELAK